MVGGVVDGGAPSLSGLVWRMSLVIRVSVSREMALSLILVGPMLVV